MTREGFMGSHVNSVAPVTATVAVTEQIDDAVVVAGVQLDQVFEEEEKAGVYHPVVQILLVHLWTQTHHGGSKLRAGNDKFTCII